MLVVLVVRLHVYQHVEHAGERLLHPRFDRMAQRMGVETDTFGDSNKVIAL